MICVYCGREIYSYKEEYELHGCDGDFIHEKCKNSYYEEMNRVLNMTDTEFTRWFRPEN